MMTIIIVIEAIINQHGNIKMIGGDESTL